MLEIVLENSSSQKKIAAVCAILPILMLSFASSATALTSTSPTGIMIPLYSYPDSTWSQVIQEKNNYPNVPFVAIINPNNGPDTFQDPNFVSWVQQMQSVGIVVIGYVYTSYTGRSISAVEQDINLYKNWYHVNGIFFDEMSNISGDENYYSTLKSYVKSQGMTLAVGNPGTTVPTTFIGTMDVLVIYEAAGLPSISTISGLYSGYSKSNFGLIAYRVSSFPSQSYITSISNYGAYVYFTNDRLPDPYNTLPSYFHTEVASLNSGITSSTTTTTTTTTSASTTIITTTSTTAVTTTVTSSATTKTNTSSKTTVNPFALLTIKSNDMSNNPIYGLWTEIRSNGVTLLADFTTVTYTTNVGSTYTVCMSNYQNYKFDHWDNGSTNSCATISPTQDTTLTAYYRT